MARPLAAAIDVLLLASACGGDSTLPPQCGGPDIEGWDWDAIDGEQSMNGTTWVDAHVVGTYDRETFTVTERPRVARPGEDDEPDDESDFSPACDEPTVVDASAGVAEWDAASQDKGMPPLPHLVAAWVTDDPFVANVVVRPDHEEEVEELVREYYDGPLCVVERDAPTAAELRAIQDDVNALRNESPLGIVLGRSRAPHQPVAAGGVRRAASSV